MAFPMHDYRAAKRKPASPVSWARCDEVARYSSGDRGRDIILGHDASIAFYESDKTWENGVNNNVFCFGGTGSGKTYNLIMPNLANHLQCNYVVTDPKGELLRRMGGGFERDGYTVQTLDTVDLGNSVGYDPLRYIVREEDILSVAVMILDAISPDRARGIDPFWEQAAELYLRSLIGLLWDCEHVDGCFAEDGDPSCERRYLKMNRLFDLMDLMRVTEAFDGEIKCPLDYLVEGLEMGGINETFFEGKPDGYGPSQYHMFRTAAARTLKSILITLHANMSKLDTEEMRRIFEHDEVRLDAVDEGRRFIDVKMSDCDPAKAHLANIFLKQLVITAERKADANADGRLERPLMFVLDEFPNVGRIAHFERTIATVRSRGISFLLCAQSISQLSGVYGEATAKTILDNCDTVLYMGSGSSIETASFVSHLCGEAVLGTQRVGVERVAMGVRDSVIRTSDVSLLPRTDCLVKIAGCRAFRTKKFGVHEHPDYERFVAA